MEPVEIVSGTAVPLRRADVDTDQIIPSDWLKRVERTGFDKGLFSEWRDNRDFVLNDDRFEGAVVLVAGPNFGTGSSREHAVWAIQQYGFGAVVVTIDVANLTLDAPDAGITCGFPLDAATQERFLMGLDDIGISLRHEAAIAGYEADRSAWMPTTS